MNQVWGGWSQYESGIDIRFRYISSPIYTAIINHKSMVFTRTLDMFLYQELKNHELSYAK